MVAIAAQSRNPIEKHIKIKKTWKVLGITLRSHFTNGFYGHFANSRPE